MSAPSDASPSVLSMLVRRPLFWFAIVGILAASSLLRILAYAPAEPPPEFGRVPDFALTAESGAPFGSDDLRGKAWISNFIFTRCKTVCPVFSAKMAVLQGHTRALSDDVQLVSFSVDPDFDTPEVLAKYSQQFGADPTFWRFLTGPTADVRSVVTDGMKMFMGDADQVETPDALMHGSHFVLVDAEMNIRGFYEVEDEATVDKLLRDLELIVSESR